MQPDSPLSGNIKTHRPYYYYLQLFDESIRKNTDPSDIKNKGTIANLLPYFKDTLNLIHLRSNKKLCQKKFVQTVLLIYRSISNCNCCDQYNADQFDMLTQIIRLLLLNIYAHYFTNLIQVSHRWNRELRISNDINSYIAKNHYFQSLYCHNNDVLFEELFPKIQQ